MKHQNDLEPVLTVKEIAELHNVSERTVRRRIETGELTAIRDGRLIRVRARDLRAYQLARLLK
jgi:excisionase family DNA binding protein